MFGRIIRTRTVMHASSVVAGVALVVSASLAVAQGVPIKHTVPSDGHPMTLWEKRAAKPTRTIVLLHGRTWSSLPDFDLQVPGEHRSLMDALVAKGYAVYALDLRGYGGTPRDASGWNNPNRAAADLAAAVQWVSKNSGIAGKPALFGWSNGATVSHLMAQQHPELIASLVLFGYWKDADSLVASGADTVTPARAKTTAAAAASDFITPTISKRAIDIYVKAALAADPVRTDWRRMEEYNALAPQKLTVPTLLMTGEHDPLAPEASQKKFFERLTVRDKQWVTIKNGDHAALMEDMQPEFVRVMTAFIERKR
jgi:pimeloyl-ACP methyl ester carboxylesterase